MRTTWHLLEYFFFPFISCVLSEKHSSVTMSHRLRDRFILLSEAIHEMNYHYGKHPHACCKASKHYKK